MKSDNLKLTMMKMNLQFPELFQFMFVASKTLNNCGSECDQKQGGYQRLHYCVAIADEVGRQKLHPGPILINC